MKKTLTICIPTYKRLKYMNDLLNSIPSDLPVIISDNGNYIQNEFDNFNNVSVIHTNTIIPVFENWNNAINEVKTEWFIIPGDDDVFFKDKLANIAEYLNKYKDMGMIIFGHKIIDENNQISKGWTPKEESVYQPPIGFSSFITGVPARVPSIIFNTRKFLSCGSFDQRFTVTAADSFLIQKLALKYPYALIPIELSSYRVWTTNFTSTKISTPEWLNEIKLWQSSLRPLIEEENGTLKINIKKMQDKVLFDNELFAIQTMKKNKVSSIQRFNFITKIGWPRYISLKNHLQLIKNIIS